MIATASRMRGVGIFLLVAILGLGAGTERVVADDGMTPLQPIPQNSTYPQTADPATADYYAQTPAQTPVQAPMQAPQQDNTFHAEAGDCDFCGLPLCSPPGRFWLRSDYLIWWTNGQTLPPLVTSSPVGTAKANAGVLGKSGTTILFGNETIGDNGRSGVRTVVGMWLDPCRVWDLEFDYLNLGGQSSSYNSGFSTGNPILARPFFDVEDNAQASELIAFPDTFEGTITALAKDYFQGAGVSLSYNLCTSDSCGSCDPCNGLGTGICDLPLLFCSRTDLIVGFRYYSLGDSVLVHEVLRVTQAGAEQYYAFDIYDSFRGRNEFYGSELGLRTQVYRGRWSLEVLTKLALGNNHQVATINGHTIITPPTGPTAIYDAGVFAVGTNSGTYTRDTFTVIPQLGLELGYQLNSNWRTYLGYNILYWGDVLRGGDQIDLNLDPRNFPPPLAGGLPFPAFPGRTSSFWAHGMNVGLECRF